MSYGDLFLLALQLAALLAILNASWRLAGRTTFVSLGAELVEGVDTERVLAAGTIALSLMLAVMQILGFSGTLTRPAVLAASALLWATSRIATRGHPTAVAGRLGRSPARPSVTGRWVAAGGVLMVVVLTLRALLFAPTDWDGLTYHYFYPATFLQQEEIAAVEFGQPHDKVSLFPANGELIHAFQMSIVRADLLVAAGMVACWMLFALAVARLAQLANVRSDVALAVGLLAATVPALMSRAASSYVEPLLDFALVVVLIAVHGAISNPATARWAAGIGGLAGGIACGTKYVAVPWVAFAFVALVSSLRGRIDRSELARVAALFLGGAALLSAVWYGRNFSLVGNPFYPAPFLGLPYLERPGLIWNSSNLLARWRDLADRGLLGDALFGLAPGRYVAGSLGWFALLAFPVAIAATILEGARVWTGRRAASSGGAGTGAMAALLVPGAFLCGVATYLAQPFWGNDGWFRSGVRFAVPALSLAVVLTFSLLTRFGVPASLQLALAALGIAVQLKLAGFHRLPPGFAGGAALVAAPLVATIWLLRRRSSTRFRSAALPTLAFLAAVTAGALAWSFREAARELLWSRPRFVAADFYRAARATERAHPGETRIAWATSSHSEFLYVFAGRRLERRVLAIPVQRGSRAAYSYADGNARRNPDREAWVEALRAESPELLVVSRWKAYEGRWPVEDSWARELAFPLVEEQEDFRIYEVPDYGSRGG